MLKIGFSLHSPGGPGSTFRFSGAYDCLEMGEGLSICGKSSEDSAKSWEM